MTKHPEGTPCTFATCWPLLLFPAVMGALVCGLVVWLIF